MHQQWLTTVKLKNTSTIHWTATADKLILLGDFNARVGKDHKAWPQTLGKFGRSKMNSNSEMLLTKCSKHQLAITITFFNYSNKWYHSWKHPRSKDQTLLDYIITRRCDLKDFCSTSAAMRGAECSTDHFMIRSKCNIKPKPPPIKKKGSKPQKETEHGETEEPKWEAQTCNCNQWEHFNITNWYQWRTVGNLEKCSL